MAERLSAVSVAQLIWSKHLPKTGSCKSRDGYGWVVDTYCMLSDLCSSSLCTHLSVHVVYHRALKAITTPENYWLVRFIKTS